MDELRKQQADSESPPRPTVGPLSPWQRLKERFTGFDQPVNPRGPMVKAPRELRDWSMNVSAVVVAAMLFSGSQEARKHKKQPVDIPRDMPSKLHGVFVRNQQAGRNAYVLGRAVAGGWYGLVFGGSLYGADTLLGIAYNGPRKEFTALSGAATGLAAGALLPGNLAFRLSRALLGAFAGVTAGYAAGWLQYDLAAAVSR